MFGDKNDVAMDRDEHGFVRRFSVTNASAHDGAQAGATTLPAATPKAHASAAASSMLLRPRRAVRRGDLHRAQGPRCSEAGARELRLHSPTPPTCFLSVKTGQAA